MNKTPVKRIEELICFLPSKDVPFAEKFISTRDFESLKDLVHSAVKRVERNLKSSNIKEEYSSVDLKSLNKLKAEVDSYLYILGYSSDEIYDIDHEDYSSDYINTDIDDIW